MNIAPINLLNYNNIRKNNRQINFSGGYKDIADFKKRIWFEKTLDNYINRTVKYYFFRRIEDVKVNGKPARLEKYHNCMNYVLTSQDNKIKAVMELEETKNPQLCCDNDFYAKNKGAIKILLLFSKGEGAGSYLIKEAVKRSHELGYDGRVILYANSLNREAGCPIPFYYKLGFKSDRADRQSDIEKGMEYYRQQGIYTGPIYSEMYLDPARIAEYLK